LAVTLWLSEQHGDDRSTVDVVTIAANAGTATAYRRWPSKAEPVVSGFTRTIWLRPIPVRGARTC
jgi:hypothetical protein